MTTAASTAATIWYCERRIVNDLPHMVFNRRSKRDFHRTIFQALQAQYCIDLRRTVLQSGFSRDGTLVWKDEKEGTLNSNCFLFV